MNTKLRRSAVALATAFASLMLLAAPAAAHSHSATLTGGTFSSTGLIPFTHTLGGTVGSGCTPTVSIDVDHTAQTGDITTFTIPMHFTLGSVHYVSTITRSSSTVGTVSQTATSGLISNLGVGLSIVIRAAANNSSTNVDCTTTGTVLCTLRVVNPLRLSGSYTHTGTGSIESSNTFALSSTSSAITIGIGTCMVPFSTYNGQTATITGLTGHIDT